MAWPPKRRRSVLEEAMQACRLKPCTCVRPAALALRRVHQFCTPRDGRLVLFHEPGCHRVNDTGVPVPAPDQDYPVLQMGRSASSWACAGDGFALGLLLVVSHRPVPARQRVPHPHTAPAAGRSQRCSIRPARVDAGGWIADILGGHGLAAQPHLIQQGQKAGGSERAEAQAALTESAVLPVRGITLATVPTAARSPQKSSISGVERPAWHRSSKATPAPHRPLKGLVPLGVCGLPQPCFGQSIMGRW